MTILQTLFEKKQRLDRYRPLPSELQENLDQWFKIELTYTSNAIEGNTLTRAETAQVVEKGLTVEGKTLQEHLEAVNHAMAFEQLLLHVPQDRQAITETMILDLHQQILQKIDDTNAGRYRTVAVRIAGSTVVLPNSMKVPTLMDEYIEWLQTSDSDSVTRAADAHYRLVSIHPFTDGNGRTARLLMNALLLQAGFPPAIIRKEDRNAYIDSLERAQLGGSLTPYHSLMYQAVDRSLDVYLAAVEQTEQTMTLVDTPLLKVGQLAKLTGETPPTIRHWTALGLLEIAQYSPGGYHLYDQNAVNRVQTIRELQRERRLTLEEIKREIDTTLL